MGILDGIVEWIAEQVMAGLDLVTTSAVSYTHLDVYKRQVCMRAEFHRLLSQPLHSPLLVKLLSTAGIREEVQSLCPFLFQIRCV